MLSDRDRRDIQGLVLFGTTCPLLRYHFFQVHESTAGRRFVHTLLERGAAIQVNTACSRNADDPAAPSLVYVGFTWRGLEALAVSRVSLDSLPLGFREGAGRRAADLDVGIGGSSADPWLLAPDEAHIAVLVYAGDRQTLEVVSRELIGRANSHACSLLLSVDGEALEHTVDPATHTFATLAHLADRDERSDRQVVAAVWKRADGALAVPPGTLILGRRDGADDGGSVAVLPPPMPIPNALAHNGTFGAFRMCVTSDGAIDRTNGHDVAPHGTLGLVFTANLDDQFESLVPHPVSQERTTGPASPAVRTRAAAYLLFPSITGLRLISQLSDDPQTDLEKGAVDEAIEVVVRAMMKAIGTGTVRDAHPKHHGLVKATVDIAADLPDTLRHGLFATPRRYDAYIRFSNGRPSPTPLPDAAPDVRGMAIKLFGVEGTKETADEKYTHDFILASHPVFFLPDVFAYVDFLELPTLADKMRLFPELGRSFRCFESPLTIKYFSQTPYALGPHVIKYIVQPLNPAEQDPIDLTPEAAAARTPDYLREAMASHLAQRPARLALCVQLPPDPAAAQVDDATRLWNTPAVTVATISIAAQDFRTPAQDRLADNISFSPWHCLTAHRPLGSVNLARRRVYREASMLRHLNGATPVKEPDGLTDF